MFGMYFPDVNVQVIFLREFLLANVADKRRVHVLLHHMTNDVLFVHQLATSHPLTIKQSSIILTDSVIHLQVGWEIVREDWHAALRSMIDDPAARVGTSCNNLSLSFLNVLSERPFHGHP